MIEYQTMERVLDLFRKTLRNYIWGMFELFWCSSPSLKNASFDQFFEKKNICGVPFDALALISTYHGLNVFWISFQFKTSIFHIINILIFNDISKLVKYLNTFQTFFLSNSYYFPIAQLSEFKIEIRSGIFMFVHGVFLLKGGITVCVSIHCLL